MAKTQPKTDNGGPLAMSAVTRFLLAGIGVLTLLHLALSFIPGIRSWGIDYWSEFPVIVRLGVAALIGLMMVPRIAGAVDLIASAAGSVRAAPLVGLAALAVLFLVFRSHGHSYGDGYSFIAYFTGGNLPTISSQLLTQALDLVSHWALFKFVIMPLGGTVALSYAIWGALAGVASVVAIWRIACAISNDRGARRLMTAAALTSGTATLWFGYVESYALVNAALLWAIVFAVEAQRKPERMWRAWGVWVVAVSFHQLAVAVLPALIWAQWRARHPQTSSGGRSNDAVLFGLGFLGWAAATTIYRIVGPPIFVPILSTADSLYAALSLDHVSDAINLIIFLAPMGAIGLALWLTRRGETPGGPPAAHGVIAVAAACTLYFAFWVDPLIGAFRDWDLLAVFGIPLSVWAASALAAREPKRRPAAWLWVPVSTLALAHTGGFVAALQSETAAAMRVDRLVRQDVHYSGGFFDGTRLPAWAAVLAKALNRYDLARDHLAHRVALDPGDAVAWANLGNAYKRLNIVDSGIICYEEALARDSLNGPYANNLGVLKAQASDVAGARDALERAVALSDTSYGSRSMLGLVYVTLGMQDEAQAVLEDAIRLRPDQFGAYYTRGLLAEYRRDTAAAIADYQAAVARGGDLPEIFTRLVQLYQWSRQLPKAIEAAQLWEQRFPAEFDAPFLAGTCYIMLKDYAAALAPLSRALDRNPQSALTLYYLASCHRNLMQPEKAREFAQRSIQADSNLHLPWLEMAYLESDAGDQAAAKTAAREYIRRSPADSGMSYLQQFK